MLEIIIAAFGALGFPTVAGSIIYGCLKLRDEIRGSRQELGFVRERLERVEIRLDALSSDIIRVSKGI